MKSFLSLFVRGLNILVVVALAAMSILVLGNVIMRYMFNSGIAWSEELSRYLFMWMVFLGSIVVLKEKEHLSVDMLTKKFPRPIKKIVYIAGNLVQLYILGLVFYGSWKMTSTNFNTYSPASGLPFAYVYGVGLVFSVGMAIVILINIYRVIVDKDALDINA